jgi:membrane protein implicated in regulation of membrane protease activity
VVTALSFYLGCLAFGGLFVAASAFAGHNGHGPDHAGHDGPGDHQGTLVPLLSLRFWTFSLAFFGLAGASLTAAGALAAPALPLVAGAVGVAAGYGASRLLGSLARRPVGLVGSSESHIGREGTLLLPVAPGLQGKIRISIGGASTDLIAETDGPATLPAGATVLVVGLRGNVAVVDQMDALPPLSQGKETK